MAYEIFKGGSGTSIQVDRDKEVLGHRNDLELLSIFSFRAGLNEGNVKIMLII